MSWSLSVQAPRSEIKAKAAEAFETAAKPYAGTEEERDVLAVRDRLLVEIEMFQDGVLAPDKDAPNGYDVSVYAYGSRSAGTGWVSVHGEVSRIKRP